MQPAAPSKCIVQSRLSLPRVQMASGAPYRLAAARGEPLAMDYSRLRVGDGRDELRAPVHVYSLRHAGRAG